MAPKSVYGVIGVFLILLGAGAIFDGDWIWRGSALIGVGAWSLYGSTESTRGEGTSPA